ncbi:MAG: TetR/AcrR family transcriptional regulator [Flavobacteriales bacterium]|nr:TetR/AcrR family transcriptional regulator [Flavobacteriales bacterium]MCB9447999.1 TetR/AcrR family transcriptional regulator [Flavobacteriales bacterium]
MNAKKVDKSTEEKIKAAGRKLFTKKGFAATKTREIAEEAGINLALLNYYFRSKEKLFEIIMQENMATFIKGMAGLFNDDSTSVQDKMAHIASGYIDLLTQFPDLPLFILREMHHGKADFPEKVDGNIGRARMHFMEQIEEAMAAGKLQPMHTFHVMANLMGMTIFPFIAAPILKKFSGVSQKEYKQLIEERRQLIPIWMNAMLEKKPTKR